MNKAGQGLLSMLFGRWREIAEETCLRLGEESAFLFVRLYNDALDLHGAIGEAYPEEELLQSLVFAEFVGLLKELYGLHVLFVSGQDPLVVSRLRFNWERIFRARHADMFAQEKPGDTDSPGPTVGDKHDWLTRRDALLWAGLTV
jgi:hypothetical protein